MTVWVWVAMRPPTGLCRELDTVARGPERYWLSLPAPCSPNWDRPLCPAPEHTRAPTV